MAKGIKFGSNELNTIKGIEQRISGAIEDPDKERPEEYKQDEPAKEEEKPVEEPKKRADKKATKSKRVGEGSESFVDMPSNGTGAAITLDDEIYFAIQKMRMDNGRMSIKKICYNLVREGLIARGYLK